MLTQVHPGNYFWKPNEKCEDYVGRFEIKELSRNLYTQGPVVELWSFGIYGKFRCQGYGQKMLQEAVKLAGDRKLMLYVEKSNEMAIHIYKKAGFEITGEFGGFAWAMTYCGNEVGKTAIESTACCA